MSKMWSPDEMQLSMWYEGRSGVFKLALSSICDNGCDLSFRVECYRGGLEVGVFLRRLSDVLKVSVFGQRWREVVLTSRSG